jgi:tellurite resistance protein TerC
MNANELVFFGGFILFIIAMLSLDLGVFNKKEEAVSLKQALAWTAVWVSLAVGFYFVIRFYGDRIHGISSFDDLAEVIRLYRQNVEIVPGDLSQSLDNYRKVLGLEYLTGYVLEESLSVDNIFVIILILSAFGVDKRHYHKVLFWGILGALVFRFIFIFTGAYLVTKFHWILYVFAAFLIFTGIKMFLSRDQEETIDPKKHPMIKFVSRFVPVLPHFEGSRFFVKKNGKTHVTPLFIVLLIIELTDLVFAVDSIPAIFGVTKDPYVIFFSNIFAILGLRSMFFVLLSVMGRFHYFKTGLSILLVYIGVKMTLGERLTHWGFTIKHSLLLILVILGASIAASLLFPKKHSPRS